MLHYGSTCLHLPLTFHTNCMVAGILDEIHAIQVVTKDLEQFPIQSAQILTALG